MLISLHSLRSRTTVKKAALSFDHLPDLNDNASSLSVM